jgi:hypothetical protein
LNETLGGITKTMDNSSTLLNPQNNPKPQDFEPNSQDQPLSLDAPDSSKEKSLETAGSHFNGPPSHTIPEPLDAPNHLLHTPDSRLPKTGVPSLTQSFTPNLEVKVSSKPDSNDSNLGVQESKRISIKPMWTKDYILK